VRQHKKKISQLNLPLAAAKKPPIAILDKAKGSVRNLKAEIQVFICIKRCE